MLTIEKPDKNHPCNGCHYWRWIGLCQACNYCLLTGHKRGCPAGAGCDKIDGFNKTARDICMNNILEFLSREIDADG